ncbi:MAG: hypothetical protein ACK4TA_17495 [Saprospiraceae bacterium]
MKPLELVKMENLQGGNFPYQTTYCAITLALIVTAPTLVEFITLVNDYGTFCTD